MTEPKNQNLKPFQKDEEGMGHGSSKSALGKTHVKKEEKEDDSSTKKYRVLTPNAIIGGVKHSDQKNGHYGEVELTHNQFREHQMRGVALAKVD